MNRQDIFNSVTETDDKTVDAAQNQRPKKRPIYKRPSTYIALAAAVALILCAAFVPNLIHTGEIKVVAFYPEVAPAPDRDDYQDHDEYRTAYDKWRESKEKFEQYSDKNSGTEGFFEKSIPMFLQCEPDSNAVYSPFNLYMALSMLTELSDGDTRDQLTELLGVKDVKQLRTQANAMWLANYLNDDQSTSIFANSLWLNQQYSFNRSVLKNLADNYYVSSFSGRPGSPKFDAQLQNWVNEQTGGLLEQSAKELRFDKEGNHLMSLVSTVYFKDAWSREFIQANNETGKFYTNTGEVDCEYMCQSGWDIYFRGDNFGLIERSFQGGHSMWLMLPDEGVSVDQLLKDKEALGYMVSSKSQSDYTYSMIGQTEIKPVKVNLKLPKFDVSGDIDLIDGLKAMGVDRAFDPQKADFSSVVIDDSQNQLKPYFNKAQQSVRVKINNEGCEATAFTVGEIIPGGIGDPEGLEEVDFILDRPFIFFISGDGGVPLFAGVVNNPTL